MDNQNYIKYQKYKNKYLNLKNQIGGGDNDNCYYNIDDSRAPSNCDRIIYKSNYINFIDYKVISEREFQLIKFSDHKMIYGTFYYNNDQYMIISWNISAFDHKFDKIKYEIYIKSNIETLINNTIKTNNKYLIFSFQESTKNSLFIEILIKMITYTLNMKLLKRKISEPNPLFFSKYCVQLLVFTTYTDNITKIDSGYSNLQVNNYVGQSFMSKLQQTIKNFFGTKSYVYMKINDLMIVSAHFPIDTNDKKDLGNSLRILALNEIDNKFNKETNLIIIGDLNFRKLNKSDQLDELLKTKNNFIEPKQLLDTTCKYNKCKLICDNQKCQIHNK